VAKLTKRTIEAAQPDPARDVFVWDEELRGFGVRIKPSGVRSYVVQYRNVLGRSRRVNLGRHGVLTADEARRLARAHLGSVARGDDPAQERRDKRESLTVSELVGRYKTDHAPKNKPITRTENFRLIDKHILPALGALAIAEVTTAHVARLHASMASAPYSANRVLYLVAILFNLAEKWRLLPRGSNPARDVEEYRETARERYLSELEIRRLGKGLAAAEADEPEKVAAVKLLLLTGCRRGEIFSLRWQDIDRERRLLNLADSKTGPRPVMLSSSALAVIDRIPERHDVWVFPNPTNDGPIREMRKFWGAVLKAASITNLRLHDLRHTALRRMASRRGFRSTPWASCSGIGKRRRRSGMRTSPMIRCARRASVLGRTWWRRWARATTRNLGLVRALDSSARADTGSSSSGVWNNPEARVLPGRRRLIRRRSR